MESRKRQPKVQVLSRIDRSEPLSKRFKAFRVNIVHGIDFIECTHSFRKRNRGRRVKAFCSSVMESSV